MLSKKKFSWLDYSGESVVATGMEIIVEKGRIKVAVSLS